MPSLTDLAGALGDVVLDDGRDHRGLLAEVDGAGGHGARGVHQVGVAAHARQRLLDALELADGGLELAAHAGIGADGAHRQLLHAGVGEGSEIERPAARHSISMRQPWPAIFGPPMMKSSGMKTSLPRVGPFWNTALSGKWRRPMFRRRGGRWAPARR
jgi:hypothetical protein